MIFSQIYFHDQGSGKKRTDPGNAEAGMAWRFMKADEFEEDMVYGYPFDLPTEEVRPGGLFFREVVVRRSIGHVLLTQRWGYDI